MKPDNSVKSDSVYFTVIYFEKGVWGHKSNFFDSFLPAHDLALKLSKDAKYHGVHIIKTEHFYYYGG